MRGLSIVLVVMFHVQLVDMATGANHSLCTTLPTIFTPIRMPFFIFTSGGLLYLSRIRREWTTRARYADKLQRIAIPFVFFVTFYYLFKLLAGAWAKTPVPLSLSYFAECFYRFTGHPSAHLWFLATLLMLMALYPLFVAVCRNHTASVALLLFSVGIYHADLESVLPDVFYINHLHHYLVFFYFGIFFFRYRLYRFTDSPIVAVAAVAVYAASYCVVGGLATSIAGIVMCMAVGQSVARRLPGLFGSFRDYIYQIYLMSMFFQAFVELVLWKRLFYDERIFLVFYALNILAGIYLPTLVARLAQRQPYRLVRLCLGIKA